ncbi:recombinase-like helix-turn-helix domain-containing protein [Shimia sediminis]|uniref:recombinase-like helix-turn-helix domain-containing protein n=1 Tax=Shimia sediminis TaxID=2497945 RepID=UPI000F8E40A4|nr:recombinase-like helix-turn-helix domain-containing protein [Shimia sediminis]
MKPERYLVVHQSRDREPTEYEDLLGDALERAFADGISDLDSLVAALNALDAPSPRNETWTTDLFLAEMKRLSA